jgi:hypothetical protein
MKKIVVLLCAIVGIFAMSINSSFHFDYELKKLVQLENGYIAGYYDDDGDDKIGIVIFDVNKSDFIIKSTLNIDVDHFNEYDSVIHDIKQYKNFVFLAVEPKNELNATILIINANDINNPVIYDKILTYNEDSIKEEVYCLQINNEKELLSFATDDAFYLYDLNSSNITLIKKYNENTLSSYRTCQIIFTSDNIIHFRNDSNSYIYAQIFDYSLNLKNTKLINGYYDLYDTLYDSNEERLYATFADNNYLLSFKIFSDNIENDLNITVSNAPYQLALTSDKKNLFISTKPTNKSPRVFKYDITNKKITDETPNEGSWSFNTYDLALVKNDTYLLNSVEGKVYNIDPNLTINSNNIENEEFNITLHHGWNLVGMINNLYTFDLPDYITIVWGYDEEINEWVLYTKDYVDGNYGYLYLYELKKGKGYWFYNENNDEIFSIGE